MILRILILSVKNFKRLLILYRYRLIGAYVSFIVWREVTSLRSHMYEANRSLCLGFPKAVVYHRQSVEHIIK